MTEPAGTQFRDQIVECLPNLRAFARSIAIDAARADDLVQDTIVKALANVDKFQPGTNVVAWLFTILRNHYYTELRNRRREVEDGDGVHAARLVSLPRQISNLEMGDFQKALARCRTSSARRWCWWVDPGFPMKKPPIYAGVPLAPSRAGSIGHACGSMRYWIPRPWSAWRVRRDADRPFLKGAKIGGVAVDRHRPSGGLCARSGSRRSFFWRSRCCRRVFSPVCRHCRTIGNSTPSPTRPMLQAAVLSTQEEENVVINARRVLTTLAVLPEIACSPAGSCERPCRRSRRHRIPTVHWR